MVGAGLLSVVPKLLRQLLERGRRRSRLLIAGETIYDVGWDRGPAGELSLERHHGGDGLWRRADPQDACFVIVRDGGVENLREKRQERIVPADDHRQVRVLGRDAVATHPYLRGCGC